jgi:exodeoxyribonuclease V alpha subunit
LQAGSLSGVHYHADAWDPLQAPGREELLAPWRALRDCDDPQSALLLAGQIRLLTALREGPQGANPLNARIEALLAGIQRDRYFHGRLLLVTENSPRHGLFNGDLGVCLRGREPAGTRAWFAADRHGSGLRQFPPAALPAHDSAFAMTVHKAQGSEFDEVWLLLPQQDARVLSRELLYTAMTRARSRLHVCASQSVLRVALQRHEQRISGLVERLNTQMDTPAA